MAGQIILRPLETDSSSRHQSFTDDHLMEVIYLSKFEESDRF